MHDIHMKEICITHKKISFLIIFSGYIIQATLYGSKLCFIIIHTFILHLYMIFTPFYSNDGTAQVTHFSSTLSFSVAS